MALPLKETLGIERERFPVVERPTTPEVSPEVKHIEVVRGEEITLPQPVTDDTGQVVVDNVVPQQVTVTLPLTEDQIARALHLKIIYSLRWLAEWCKRLIKMAGGRFVYKLT